MESPDKTSGVTEENYAKGDILLGGYKTPNLCQKVYLVVIHISLFNAALVSFRSMFNFLTVIII
jgi:hypothetical protein